MFASSHKSAKLVIVKIHDVVWSRSGNLSMFRRSTGWAGLYGDDVCEQVY